MTVILLYDSSHEVLWHLVGMPKVSLWAVCWALTTGEGELCIAATWKPHNTVVQTFGIWGSSGMAVTETHRNLLMSGHFAQLPWWGLPMATGWLCSGNRDAGFALLIEDRHMTLIRTYHIHFLCPCSLEMELPGSLGCYLAPLEPFPTPERWVLRVTLRSLAIGLNDSLWI